MSESAYKLVCSSIDIKDPTILQKKITKTIAVDNYLSEINSNTQTDKRFGIKKEIYHSQVFLKVNASSNNETADGANAGIVFPFWQIASPTVSTNYDIGRVVLKIRHDTASTANNSASTQLFRIVGTKQDGTETATLTDVAVETTANNNIMYTNGITSVSTSTDTMISALGTLGTAANIYESPFYIVGEDASSVDVNRTYDIDFNTTLKSSATANKPIALGLRLNQTPSGVSIYVIDSYVEVISPDYTSYINTHVIS
jgi:hypothetical protein